jgi:hypothetical protein
MNESNKPKLILKISLKTIPEHVVSVKESNNVYVEIRENGSPFSNQEPMLFPMKSDTSIEKVFNLERNKKYLLIIKHEGFNEKVHRIFSVPKKMDIDLTPDLYRVKLQVEDEISFSLNYKYSRLHVPKRDLKTSIFRPFRGELNFYLLKRSGMFFSLTHEQNSTRTPQHYISFQRFCDEDLVDLEDNCRWTIDSSSSKPFQSINLWCQYQDKICCLWSSDE